MSRKKPPKPPAAIPEPIAQPAPVNDEPKAPKKFRDSWMYRSVRWTLRAAAALLFMGYVAGTYGSAYTWAQVKWVRSHDLSELPQIADYYINHQYSNQKLHKWVSMRPEAETPQIIKILEPYTPKLSTLTFFAYSKRLHDLGMNDEALFWWQFTRYRARFDALRCGSIKSVESLSHVIDLFPHPDFAPTDTESSQQVVKSLHAVLDYDAKYPAHNNPDDVCDNLRALEPGSFATVRPDKWQDIRHSLRYITEYRLNIMEEELKGIKHKKAKQGLMSVFDEQMDKAAAEEDAKAAADAKAQDDDAAPDNKGDKDNKTGDKK